MVPPTPRCHCKVVSSVSVTAVTSGAATVEFCIQRYMIYNVDTAVPNSTLRSRHAIPAAQKGARQVYYVLCGVALVRSTPSGVDLYFVLVCDGVIVECGHVVLHTELYT